MSRSVELAAFLALNPGADRHGLDYALWPNKYRDSARRDQVVSRTRSWLGQEHFPRISKTGDARYRLGPRVTCDWSRFQDLARTGHADPTEDGNLALRRALALVRGRPFAATNPGRYEWAAPVIEDMISAIGHAAAELSTRCREAGDIPGALWAAHRGLLAAADNELLHRQIFLAHHAAGDIDALRQAAANLAKINEGERPGDELDMETETAKLLRSLLPQPTATC
ncbi:AfsR/SARP family transcriptional regulator [Streptomyces violascens]|uniref:AfsR/SARP family transcriptional regulator n=1 Tax=Streptomyces violascens TaxID=67381 RepID=UPI0036502802